MRIGVDILNEVGELGAAKPGDSTRNARLIERGVPFVFIVAFAFDMVHGEDSGKVFVKLRLLNDRPYLLSEQRQLIWVGALQEVVLVDEPA